MKLVLGKRGKWGIRDAPYAIKTWDKLPEKVKRLVHLMVVMLPPGEKYNMGQEWDAEVKAWGAIEKNFGTSSDFQYNTVKGRYGPVQLETAIYEIKIANKWVEQWIREEDIISQEKEQSATNQTQGKTKCQQRQ